MITPSVFSSAVSGLGLWTVAWAMLFKLDTILSTFGLKVQVKERSLRWIERNKVTTLAATEAVNFGLHGLTSPLGVAMALGGTAVNGFMLFVGLPVRRRIKIWRGYRER